MNFSDLFTNPLTVAALSLIVVAVARRLYETETRILPWYVAPVIAFIVTGLVYIGGMLLPDATQLQITDFMTMISVVFSAAGISLYTDNRKAPYVSRGLYAKRPRAFRAWGRE